ncbi:MAG: germination protein YpeB [Clostridia bacterium]|nr:germination protein YpeB [Clostridia bacterium]
MKKKYINMGVMVFLIVAVIGTGVWGYLQYQAKEDYYLFIDNQMRRNYHDLVGSVETISSELSKLMISTQTKENMVLFSKVWQNAYNAEDYLAQLPLSHEATSKSDKYLNQLGDYTFAMAQKSIKGDTLSQEDIENLEQLYQYSIQLSSGLNEIKDETIGGKAWQNEYRRQRTLQLLEKKTEDIGEQNSVQAQFTQFEERLNKYPELIYDGPFSEHVIQGAKPKLRGSKISIEEAEKRAKDFIGEDKIEAIERDDGSKGRIVTHSFKVQQKDSDSPIYIDISEIKGYTVSVLDNRPVEKANISRKQSIEVANDFLNEKGYHNMMPTYSLKTDNTVLINYAYAQDNVVMYPDLIKVKVALDNGDIVGFDATHFLTLNTPRDIKEPSISPAEARQSVSVRATITEEPRLCYIPTNFNGEIYCYEIKATKNDEHFLIYINADTGMEEKILKAIISENGTLMI